MGILRTRFLTPEGEKNLTCYKYSGSDSSLLYKHFFSPCAQYLVDHVFPATLAPNVITLTGFMCTLIPHLIVLIAYTPNLEGDIPAWMCFVAAIGQLWYMILDNADGKQARKTGSSSPLGLLFDHGCDAMNTFISGLTLFRVVQFGNTTSVIFAFMIAMTTFFMATWEEYYIESLNLPIVNGANEGIFFVIVIYFISGIMGCQIWNHQIGSVKANEIVLFAFIFMAVVTIASNIINVYRHDRSKFLGAIHNLFTITYMNITMVIVSYLSVSDVISTNARVLIYFIGFSFAKLVGHLQVSHVAHEKFKQYKKSILLSCTLLNINTLVGHFSGKMLMNEEILLFVCFGFSLIVYAHFVYNIISQFTRVLRIYVFKLGTRDTDDLLRFSEEFDVYAA